MKEKNFSTSLRLVGLGTLSFLVAGNWIGRPKDHHCWTD